MLVSSVVQLSDRHRPTCFLCKNAVVGKSQRIRWRLRGKLAGIGDFHERPCGRAMMTVLIAAQNDSGPTGGVPAKRR